MGIKISWSDGDGTGDAAEGILLSSRKDDQANRDCLGIICDHIELRSVNNINIASFCGKHPDKRNIFEIFHIEGRCPLHKWYCPERIRLSPEADLSSGYSSWYKNNKLLAQQEFTKHERESHNQQDSEISK
jgi:hypothetical protein